MRIRNPLSRGVAAGILAAAAVAGTLGALSTPSEAKTDSRVIRLDQKHKKIYGYTAAEWSVQWWQWAYSIPVSNNPLFDESGALCGNGAWTSSERSRHPSRLIKRTVVPSSGYSATTKSSI